MLNFSVGPVQLSDDVRVLGAEQIPYFRTAEFSSLMKENETMLLAAAGAPECSRAVFLTGSGTAGMEAAVINLLDERDRVLVVNGGSFGHRFVQLCEIHRIPHAVITVPWGHALTQDDLAPYESAGYTALLVNVHETSTGVLYDMDVLGSFCRRNGMLLVADAISAFLADSIDMGKNGIDAMIVGSQKALAVAPGVSAIVLSPKAMERVQQHKRTCMYLDLKAALKDGERGQTPFTPAVGTLIQLHKRLKRVEASGVKAEVSRVAEQAWDFRCRVVDLPLAPFAKTPSNAVTALRVQKGVCPADIVSVLKDEYGIWVCPNGGELGERIFRVGHIGALTIRDNEILESALRDLHARGFLDSPRGGFR